MVLFDVPLLSINPYPSSSLKAIARDRIIRGLDLFSYGTPNGNEPLWANLLSWGLSQAILLLGSFDLIAGLITNFYLVRRKEKGEKEKSGRWLLTLTLLFLLP